MGGRAGFNEPGHVSRLITESKGCSNTIFSNTLLAHSYPFFPFPLSIQTTALSPIGPSNQPTHCLSAPLWLKMSPGPDKGRKQGKYPRYHIRDAYLYIISYKAQQATLLFSLSLLPPFFSLIPVCVRCTPHSNRKKRESTGAIQ